MPMAPQEVPTVPKALAAQSKCKDLGELDKIYGTAGLYSMEPVSTLSPLV
jgi:hypothetical protein